LPIYWQRGNRKMQGASCVRLRCRLSGRPTERPHCAPSKPMQSSDLDRSFAGSIPQLYEQYLVPLIFEPYASEMAERVRRRRPRAVLEVAAGTGVVTRRLAAALPID